MLSLHTKQKPKVPCVGSSGSERSQAPHVPIPLHPPSTLCVTAVHIFRCRDVNKIKQVLPENGLERKEERKGWREGGKLIQYLEGRSRGITVSSILAWSTYRVLGLHIEIMSKGGIEGGRRKPYLTNEQIRANGCNQRKLHVQSNQKKKKKDSVNDRNRARYRCCFVCSMNTSEFYVW